MNHGPQVVQVRVFSVGGIGDCFAAIQVAVGGFDKVLDDPKVALLVDSTFSLSIEAGDLCTEREVSSGHCLEFFILSTVILL